VDTNVAIRPIDWQLELDQGVTDFFVDANVAIGPIGWQIELDQDSLFFLRGRQLCHQTN
jgi:hypothetical protein